MYVHFGALNPSTKLLLAAKFSFIAALLAKLLIGPTKLRKVLAYLLLYCSCLRPQLRKRALKRLAGDSKAPVAFDYGSKEFGPVAETGSKGSKLEGVLPTSARSRRKDTELQTLPSLLSPSSSSVDASSVDGNYGTGLHAWSVGQTPQIKSMLSESLLPDSNLGNSDAQDVLP